MLILAIGSSTDKVFPKVIRHLQESGHPFLAVDEDHGTPLSVQCELDAGRPCFRVSGNGCSGDRPVGSIYVRHAMARTMEPVEGLRLGALQTRLNGMLMFARCPIVNPPANAYSNYSKPYQLGLLEDAGFECPRTLITNNCEEARRFWEQSNGQVIFKGVSNVMSLAQVLTPERMCRMEHLPNSPTQFQEYVSGVDYRVHVVGDQAFATRIVTRNEDYRRSSIRRDEEIQAEAAELPPEVIRKCITFTEQLGLVLGGLDFKETAQGRLVALELNPYPQFTFYESLSGQPITQAIVNYLMRRQAADTNIFA